MVVLISIMGLSALAMSVLQPILPLYLTSIGVTPEILGLMLSAGMVGMVIGESSWGWVADKIGLRTPLIVGTFICGLAVLCFVLTQKIPAIFMIFFFWGIVRSAIFGPGRGYIGANAPQLKKATFMALITVIMSASRSLGALPGGFVVDIWGYHWVFFISSGIALLGGVVVLTSLNKAFRVKPEQPVISHTSADQIPSPNLPFSYTPLIFQGIIAFLQFSTLGISISFLPLLATQVIGVAATEVGILFTIQGLVTTILGIPIGMLIDRTGKKIFMILGLLISASAMAGMAFAASFSQLILSGILGGSGMVMCSPAAMGLLSDYVPLKRQSTAMGLYGGICENTGVMAGSTLAGFAWSAWGPRSTFLMGTIAASLGAAICFGLVKEKKYRGLRVV